MGLELGPRHAWMPSPALAVFGQAVCTLCTLFLNLQKETENGRFLPSFERSVDLGGCSDLSPPSTSVKTSGAAVRLGKE